MVDRAVAEARGWDSPELDAAIVSGIERARRSAEEEEWESGDAVRQRGRAGNGVE